MVQAFIQATEIWVPNPRSLQLDLLTGAYGKLHGFRELSQGEHFAYGDGLPGRAWAERRPLLMKVTDPAFKRARAAKAADLAVAIAFPVFAGDYLTAVLTFLCREADDTLGAIEIWHSDRSKSYDMSLADGFYGRLESFEATARRTAFRPGIGLVGQVWEEREPVVMVGLGSAHQFIRYQSAEESGLTTGLGLPFFCEDGQDYVMTFLSARGTPIARQFEVWVPGEDRRSLRFSAGYSEAGVDLNERYWDVELSAMREPLARALLTGRPVLDEQLAGVHLAKELSDLSQLVAVPILEAGRARAVVALLS